MADLEAFSNLLKEARSKEWVVYAKRPFGGPAQVLDYLGQYTHRVAISNHRLLKLENRIVTFSWRDYRDNSQIKQMSLDVDEFIRRFLLHILPTGFQRIRYFGFLSNRYRRKKLELCRELLNVNLDDKTGSSASQSSASKPQRDWKLRYEELTGISIDTCPVCKQGRISTIETLYPFYSKPGSLFVLEIRIDSS